MRKGGTGRVHARHVQTRTYPHARARAHAAPHGHASHRPGAGPTYTFCLAPARITTDLESLAAARHAAPPPPCPGPSPASSPSSRSLFLLRQMEICNRPVLWIKGGNCGEGNYAIVLISARADITFKCKHRPI